MNAFGVELRRFLVRREVASETASSRNAECEKPLIFRGFRNLFTYLFIRGYRYGGRDLDHLSLPIPCLLLLPSQRIYGMTWSFLVNIRYLKEKSLSFFRGDTGADRC